MNIQKLSDMNGGWFIGDFAPSILRSSVVEIAVKLYEAGALEQSHHHRIATEVTVIVSGQARMNGRLLVAGDIVTVDPGESAEFSTDLQTSTVVVKLPSVPGDKYSETPQDA